MVICNYFLIYFLNWWDQFQSASWVSRWQLSLVNCVLLYFFIFFEANLFSHREFFRKTSCPNNFSQNSVHWAIFFFLFLFSHYWWKKTILLMKKTFKMQFYLVLGLKCSLFSLWEKQCICSEEEYKVILLTKLLHSRVIVHRQILMKVGKRAWFETDNIMRNLVLIYGCGRVK